MAILNLGNNDAAFSGSFSGSFQGDGSALTGLEAFPFTGSAEISGSLQLDYNGNDNIFISTPGSSSGDNNLTTGTHNLVIGMNAGENLTDSNNNVILGHEAASGSQFTSAKGNNIVVGYRSGLNANPTNYGENIFIGTEAGRDSKGNQSIFIGGGSGKNAEGIYNTAIGYRTMEGSNYSTTPNYNTVVGYQAGVNLWDGNNNVAIGTSALAGGDSFKLLNNNIAIGPNTLDNAECIEFSIAIGTHALGSAHNNNYPASNPQGAGYNIAIGNYAGFSEDRGKQHIFIGEYAGYNVTNSTGSIIIGSGSRGEATLNHQLRIGNADVIAISGSLTTGDIIFANTASAPNFSGSFQGDGSNLTGITAGSTSGRVVFTTTNGELTSEAGFTYDATTNRLTVPNLTTTTFTSSFITSSQIHTSGSNIFGDDTTDTQTLIGTTKMTGSAEVTGSFKVQGVSGNVLNIGNDGSFTLGQGASGTNNNPDTSVVIGKNATVTSDDSVVIGDGATTNTGGQKTVVIGHGASVIANTSFGVVVGENAYVNGTNGVALGRSTTAGGNGIAIGRDAEAPSNSIAIGKGITANASQLEIGFENPTISASLSTGHVILSGSEGGLELIGSGSTMFEVIGSEGTLFSIDDDLDGTLLDVKDRSGIPVLQASASGEIYLGQSPQSLYTTAVISSTIADVTQSLYGLNTSSYGGAFFDYTAHSGSNARGGTVSSVWTPGGSVVFSETTTTHIGDTSNLNLVVHFSQSQAQLACYADTSQYNIKVITRAI